MFRMNLYFQEEGLYLTVLMYATVTYYSQISQLPSEDITTLSISSQNIGCQFGQNKYIL